MISAIQVQGGTVGIQESNFASSSNPFVIHRMAPHTSGTNKKSLLRYSGPLSVVMGAKFQFQNVTFWNELLFFKESMKRWVSAVVSPVSEMPGKAPSRPQPQNGSASAFTLRRDLLELRAGSKFLGCFSLSRNLFVSL